MTKKQYSKPQLIAIGDAIEMTLRLNHGHRRDRPNALFYWK